MKMQPYVKMWYDFLGEGRIMGLKCNRCGAYEFPPVPVCHLCSGVRLTWAEMSGDGQLNAFKVALHPEVAFESSWPYVNGSVSFDEGPEYGGLVEGVGPEDAEQLYRRLPVRVHAKIQDRGDYKFIAFQIMP